MTPEPPAGSAQSSSGKKSDVAPFVIFGTVFTPEGMALPGAKIEARRTGEKKIRGRATSDRRGEFGVRVPEGFEYEVSIQMKGFVKDVRKVDARIGTRFDFVVRMKPEPPKEGAGEKKP